MTLIPYWCYATSELGRKEIIGQRVRFGGRVRSMKAIRQRPTLDRPAVYEIKVPGQLDESWADWVDGMTVTTEGGSDTQPVTTLISTVDQAALQGLLRRLYSLGLPLISVKCVDDN